MALWTISAVFHSAQKKDEEEERQMKTKYKLMWKKREEQMRTKDEKTLRSDRTTEDT